MPRSKWFIASVALVLMACSHSPTSSIDSPTLVLDSVMKARAITAANLTLHIDKSDRTLTVMHDAQTLKTYPMVLGSNPINDKRMEGDRCTPEGEFGIRDMYPHAKWSRFIWIDYPTEESWSNFKKAKAAGEIPSDATVGGEVGIHGVPEGKDYLITDGTDWTWGCISLSNADVEELYRCINRSTKIKIVP